MKLLSLLFSPVFLVVPLSWAHIFFPASCSETRSADVFRLMWAIKFHMYVEQQAELQFSIFQCLSS